MTERRVAEACERLAKRMGCVFVKNERWPEIFAAQTQSPSTPDNKDKPNA